MLPVPKNTEIMVDPATGNYFCHTVDLIIPAPGLDIKIERYFNSLDASGPVYVGFKFNFDTFLRFDDYDHSISVVFPQGPYYRFTLNPNGSYSPAIAWNYMTLKKEAAGTYLLTFKDKRRLRFYANGKLFKEIDTHNNSITYYWEANRLQKIVDSVKRVLKVTYNDLDADHYDMFITDWSGRSLKYAFEVLGSGIIEASRLLSYTDPEGNTTDYYNKDWEGFKAGELELAGLGGIYFPLGLFVVPIALGERPDLERVGKLVYNTSSDFGTGALEINYSYDWDNRVTTVDEGGRITKYYFDAGGKLIQKDDAIGNQTFYEYDANGNLTKITDPRGGITSYTYDSQGNKLTETDALGNTTTYEYDSKWNKVSKIISAAPFYYETVFEYDEDTGDLLSVTDPLENVTSYEYYPNGRLKKLTDAKNHETNYAYDNFGNLITITDALEHETRFKYDQTGNVIAITDARGKKVAKGYFKTNLLKSITNALGNTGSFNYDGNSNLKFTADPLKNTLQYEFSPLNRLTRVLDALGGITGYSYDQFGNLSKIKDALGRERNFSFDALDRLDAEFDALGYETEHLYDPYCNREYVTNAEGKKTTYHKNLLCRLTRIEFHDNSYYQFGYDNLGRRTLMTQPQAKKYGEFKYAEAKYGYDHDNDTVFEYDDNSRLTRIHYPGSKNIELAYDEVGNITQIKDIDGIATDYAYDELNRLTAVTYDEEETGYEYDEVSNLTKLTLPNGITADYEYDDAYRLTRILWKKGETLLYDITYELDAAGNRVKKTIAKPSVPDKVNDYIYDALYRLVQSNLDGDMQAQYRYDSVGNRLELTTPQDKQIYHYNAADELTSVNEIIYQHDKDGNLISIKDPAEDKALRYQYDYAGRLWKVLFPDDDTTEYIYNGVGYRIKKKDKSGNIIKYYWISLNLPQVLNETDANDDTIASYILGRGLIGIKTTSDIRYYLTDGLGSIIALADEDGNITDTYDYDDFGNLTASTGTSYNPYHYTGQQYDDDTGLYYLLNRYYKAKLGRFITKDPYKGTISRPITLNIYIYSTNNPINLIDSNGLSSTGDFCIVGETSLGPAPKIHYESEIGEGWNLLAVNYYSASNPLFPLSPVFCDCVWTLQSYADIYEIIETPHTKVIECTHCGKKAKHYETSYTTTRKYIGRSWHPLVSDTKTTPGIVTIYGTCKCG